MPSLTLGGVEMDCKPALAAGQLMKLAKAMKGDSMSQLAGMYDFLAFAVVPEARAALDAALDSDDLDFEAVNEAVGNLMVSYQEGGARPTRRSSPSPSPRTAPGGTSRADSSSPATDRVVSLSSKAGLSAAS